MLKSSFFKSSKKVNTLVLYGLIGIVILLIWFSYSLYNQQRWNAFSAVNEMNRIVYLTYEDVNRMDTDEFDTPHRLQKRLYNLFNETDTLTDHFNFYENIQYNNANLLFNNTSFRRGILNLKLRHQQGLWSEVDQQYYDKLTSHLKELASVLREEHKDFDAVPLYAIFNVDKVSRKVDEINQLNFSYISNHQVSDLKVMDKDKLKKEIARLLDKKAEDIYINTRDTFYGVSKEYNFEIDGDMRGEVSPYTGIITRIGHNPRGNGNKDLSEDDAEQVAVNFLNRIFRGEYQYKVMYKGINNKHSFSGTGVPDIQLHSFDVVPLNEEYPYRQPFNNQFEVYVDKDTGEIYNFYMRGPREKMNDFFSPTFFNKTFKRNVSKQEAAKRLTEFKERNLLEPHIDIDEYSFKTTGIIYSRLSGEFELAHEFQGKTNAFKIFVNATDGYLEKPYLDEN